MTEPTMQTGDVSRRLGIPVTADLLTNLGFTVVGTDKRAQLWAQSDYPEMCERLAEFIRGKADVPMQPRPAPPPKKVKDGAAPAAAGKTPAPSPSPRAPAPVPAADYEEF